MKQRFQSQKGMTLTELLVGLLIFSLIVVSVGAVIVPNLTIFQKTTELAEGNTLLETLSALMIADLTEAAKPLAIPSAPAPISVAVTNGWGVVTDFTVGDMSGTYPGLLLRNGKAVMPPEFYKSKTVSFEVEKSSTTGSYTLTLSIFNRDGNLMAERSYAVKPLALS